MASNQSGKERDERLWIAYVCIIVASALAHLWCLQSQFYMDDFFAIRDSDLIREGRFWHGGLSAWTFFGYVVQYKLFGMSSMGFHAVNWILHTAVACVLFGFGRDFLRDRMSSGVAWFAALGFAVHPLASEIPNYTRTQDLAWVTLFSLLASWSLLTYLRGGGWKWILFTGLGCIGASLSKGPGMFHAAMMTGVVGLAFMTPVHWGMLRRRIWWIAAFVLFVFLAFWLSGTLSGFWRATDHWKEPRFIGHAYTLARVFWEFAWRAVIPIALCSDHHITETLVPPGSGWLHVPDRIAMLAAVGMLLLTAISLWLCRRKNTRLFGVCLFLFVATILFRILYLIPEFMPEYRIYPGMPWFCLGAALMMASVWNILLKGISPRFPVVLLLIVCIVMSARRSFVWHDLERLNADILHQYPAQARAIWSLQDCDASAGEWTKIMDRQQKIWPPMLALFLKTNRNLAPARELPSGHFALADVGCKANYALAVAHVRGPAAGLVEIRNLDLYMRQLRIDQSVHWAYFNTAKILVLEQAGNYQAALDLIHQPELPHNLKTVDIRRIKKEFAENPDRNR